MHDSETTITELKSAIIDMCRKKGWGGESGIQNPQHVAMALTVEVSELLEHFQWLEPEDVKRLMNGDDPERCAQIAEEYADVMMYGLQLMYALNIDVSKEIEKKIDKVMKRPANWKGGNEHR